MSKDQAAAEEEKTEVKDGPDMDDGVVEIELDGRVHKLTPTMEACVKISQFAGGGAMAIQKCDFLDMDVICKIIEVGVGFNPKQAQMIPKAVYEAGVMKCAGYCIEFVTIINNGGKRPTKREVEEESDPLPER
jgi:hypothetical protein